MLKKRAHNDSVSALTTLLRTLSDISKMQKPCNSNFILKPLSVYIDNWLKEGHCTLFKAHKIFRNDTVRPVFLVTRVLQLIILRYRNA